MEFSLLGNCFALPKVIFALRTTSPSVSTVEIWKNFTGSSRQVLSRILGQNLSDLEWNQAKLPVSMGGLGLRSPADHASAAYLSSIIQARDLLKEIVRRDETAPKSDDALQHFSQLLNDEATFSLEHLQSESQKTMSHRIDSKLKDDLLSELGGNRDKARINSLSLPHAGDWLNSIPSTILGLHLKPCEFRLAALYRLGAPIFSSEGKCPACPFRSDVYGDHAISCGYQGERIARHNQLRDVLFQTAVSAQLAPSREERALIPGVDQRPADVMKPCWLSGRDTVYHITVINSLQRTAESAGHTSKNGTYIGRTVIKKEFSLFHSQWRQWGFGQRAHPAI